MSFSEDDCTILLAVRPGVQATPDRKISEVIFTSLGYAQYSCAPKRGLGMASETSQIIERGVAPLPDETWEQARRRTEVINPLAALEVVGHRAADAAAFALGLSRRQVYVLIRRAREAAEVRDDCQSLSSASFANF
ncbi:helix-turn-helix domain-containing protein [Salmonella enterica subsp. diarizonae serovar 61:z52:z53]|nr:helix-turn-helix domain-containing protein [Salmonella enterica subsp. diarizonae serovar 61:z52:z53]EHG6221113.1 helix-turn-helix domain-containing protein [Salmonella enterica subsp. diarizonae serovar 61:z52:z53]